MIELTGNIELVSFLSMVFIVILLTISVVLLLVNLAELARVKNMAKTLSARLTRVDYLCNQVEACQIENASLLHSIFQDEGLALIINTFEEYIANSQKLYQNKWMLDPHEYFNMNYLLSNEEHNKLNNDSAYKQLAIGLLVSAFSLVFPLAFLGNKAGSVLPFAILPAGISIAFFFLFYHKNNFYRHELTLKMKHLAETISRRLPVFSNLAGSAVLVDAFIQYDKQMSKAVSRLSHSVSSLLNQEMVRAITETVQESIEKTLGPTLSESHQLLLELSQNLTQKQEQGMNTLAEHFSKELGRQIAQKLDPFYHQINAYARSLDVMVQDAKEIHTTMENYHLQAAELDNSRENHMRAIEEACLTMQQATQNSAASYERLALASERFSKLQGSGEESLIAYLQQFSAQINQFKDYIGKSWQGIEEENAKNRTYIENLVNHQKHSLDKFQILSETMMTGSQSLNRQADFINRQLEAVNTQLSSSLKNFQNQMQEGISNSINELDEGLAEITDRLSVAVSEVAKVMPKGPSSIKTNDFYSNVTNNVNKQ